jgi:hypothetical protein
MKQAVAALPEGERFALIRLNLPTNLGASYLPESPELAIPLVERAIEEYRAAVGRDEENVAGDLILLAECQLIAEHPKEAFDLLHSAGSIYEASTITGPDRRARLALRMSQAIFFAKHGRRPLAKQAVELVASSGREVPHPELDAWLEFVGKPRPVPRNWQW